MRNSVDPRTLQAAVVAEVGIAVVVAALGYFLTEHLVGSLVVGFICGFLAFVLILAAAKRSARMSGSPELNGHARPGSTPSEGDRD